MRFTIVLSTAWALTAGALLPIPARAHCVVPDTPDCACHIEGGQWPLSAVSGDVVATAHKTAGTKTSCLLHGGQPYWQIRRQIDDPDVAHFVADLEDALGLFGFTPPRHEAWCSETISFWHREARMPYPRGYETGWWGTPFVNSAIELRQWYAAEELLEMLAFTGRGRWIDGSELDYANFVPGVNGPCPGAYQNWETYNPVTGAWNSSCLHSQLVDSVVVYRLDAIDGPVMRVDVRIIDGNIKVGPMVEYDGAIVDQAGVRTNGWQRDVIQYTELGADDTECNGNPLALWKIRGWGVDLSAGGNPIYDADRIETVVVHTLVGYPAPTGPDTTGNATVYQLANYGATVASQGGPGVSTNSSAVQTGGALPTETAPWVIPPAPHPVNPVFIDVDLRAQHPTRMRGVTIEWLDGLPPAHFELWWAGQDQQIHQRPVDLPTGVPPPPPGKPLPLVVPFGPDSTYPVRYLRLVFPNAALDRTYQIAGLFPNFQVGIEDNNGGTADPGPDDIVAVGAPARASGLELLAAAPNPFARGTSIEFVVARGQRARLAIFDAASRRVRDFGPLVGTGARDRLFWNGLDDGGRPVKSGFYLAELESGRDRVLRKLVLVR